jgi:acyl CoA:acetate/3-ketoacid CoA transferase alpha subunit
MKNYIIAAVAAVVATVSLSTAAEAGWRRHHGWHGHHNFWGPRIVIRPVVYDDYCFVKKVRRYDRWGNLYIKRIRICD